MASVKFTCSWLKISFSSLSIDKLFHQSAVLRKNKLLLCSGSFVFSEERTKANVTISFVKILSCSIITPSGITSRLGERV